MNLACIDETAYINELLPMAIKYISKRKEH